MYKSAPDITPAIKGFHQNNRKEMEMEVFLRELQQENVSTIVKA